MKICFLGTGSWATALADLVADNGHDAILYGIDESEIFDINEHHQNTKYFGAFVKLHPSLYATASLKEALDQSSIVVLAVPTVAFRTLLKQVEPLLNSKPYLINVAKGFDTEGDGRLTDLIRSLIPESKRSGIISLIGPSHAEEVIIKKLTTVTATSLDFDAAEFIQQVFSNDYFRVYTNLDEVGAELGVAIKNTIAIASGILAGLNYGDNANAALITRGLAEMVRFGTHFGGLLETYMGLTGLGDLIVTCSSKLSRNFQAGYQIGLNDSAEEFLKNNHKTVEGIRTSKIIHEICLAEGIEMPISEAVYEVLFEGATPSKQIDKLMRRTLKKEN